jgi:glycosyltransferase involved in cell wall biosynthesis
MASVDVIIPVFNEAAMVAELHTRLCKACPDATIVFVDNASTDGTLAAIERLSDVKLVRHTQNLGYGRSLRDGIAASSGELIVMIDADLEYYPEDIPALVGALSTAPAVYGSRFLGGPHSEPVMPLTRRFGNALVSAVFNTLFHQRLTDLYTGIRAVRRNALPESGLQADGFEFVLELAARLADAGVQIEEVPVRYEARTRGLSKMRHVREFLRFVRRLVVLKLDSRSSTLRARGVRLQA